MNRKISADTIVMAAAIGACVLFLAATACFGEKNFFTFLCYGFGGLMIILILAVYGIFRKAFIKFSDTVCGQVEELTKGNFQNSAPEEDTLTSKIEMKLDKLSDVIHSSLSAQEFQKQEVQQMVSDISHQLKTPIANITMYSSMLDSGNFSSEQRKQFAQVIENQVKKLEFLVDSLMKMSRLETSLIHLEIKPARIFDTLFQALSQVGAKAEFKEIRLECSCDQDLMVPHDAKWTQEALFNILDNAVKYTPEGGRITVTAEVWEMFTKIDISDTGIGIAKEHYEDIFKRFYREGKVHLEEGVGIGLYLSRQIITQQGGYIKVSSKEGEGTTFSVFLPNLHERK